MNLDFVTFTLPEILSLIGLAQTLYLLVYMAFRSGSFKRAFVPFLYFFILGMAFFLDLSNRFIGDVSDFFPLFIWYAWFLGPPLSVLLVIQIVQIKNPPAFYHYWVLLLLPLAHRVSYSMASLSGECGSRISHCTVFYDWLSLTGFLAGVLSLFAIWFLRGTMEDLYAQRMGKPRYWLVLTLVLVNLLFLSDILLALMEILPFDSAFAVRSVLGIACVYLAGTSLFRIYPQALILVNRHKKGVSEEDVQTIKRIKELLDVEKVYHEASYGRSDMARELKIPETTLSRLINSHFGKSLPQLLNERRIEDAQRLLLETDVPVKVVAEEAGFNSLATFNRVFREVVGSSPSAYRETYGAGTVTH